MAVTLLDIANCRQLNNALALNLQSAKYAEFLTGFRSRDKQNAANQALTEVIFKDNRYYFQAPNFSLVAYQTSNLVTPVILTNYNHTGLGSMTRDDFSAALQAGGEGKTVMNSNLSGVVALTSEAARSKVVEQAITKILTSSTAAIDLSEYDMLFKGYSQPAKYCGYLDTNGNYTSNWKPLEKEDYRRFYMSDKYTGDRKKMCEALEKL